jgi:type IX secretion system substrate protein
VKLLVYPNPTLGVISVRTNLPNNNGLQCVITNRYGVIVLTCSISEFRTQIDLQGLSKGIYIIHLV